MNKIEFINTYRIPLADFYEQQIDGLESDAMVNANYSIYADTFEWELQKVIEDEMSKLADYLLIHNHGNKTLHEGIRDYLKNSCPLHMKHIYE
jgi:hypothetical protein